MERRRRLPSSRWLAMSLTVRRELAVARCHSSGDSERSNSSRRLVTSGKRSATRIGGIAIGGCSPHSLLLSGSLKQRLASQRLLHSLTHVLFGFTPDCLLQRLLQPGGPVSSCPGGEGVQGHVPVPDDRTLQPGLDQPRSPPREAPEVLQDEIQARVLLKPPPQPKFVAGPR